MDGFLFNLIHGNTNDELDLFNNHFFSRYADYEKIFDLLRIKMNYLSIARLTEERYDPHFLKEVQANDENLKETNAIIDGYMKTLKSLEKAREDLSKEIQKAYNSEKYDSKKIESLEGDIELISIQKKEISFKLNKQLDKKNSLLGQKGKFDSKIAKLDSDIESIRNRLEDQLSKIDVNNLEIFGAFSPKDYQMLVRYMGELNKQISNDDLRLVYYKYFYRLVNEEIKHLKDSVICADKFVKSTDKDKGYMVPELFAKNKQMLNQDLLFSHMHNNVSNAVRMFDDREYEESANMVAASYNDIEPFIIDILDYMGNFDNYSKNPDLENKAYMKLRNEYNKTYDLNDKLISSIRKTIQRITGKRRDHIKSFAYNDLALNSFDFYVNRDIYGKANSTPKKSINESKKISKFKPIQSLKSDKEFKDVTKLYEFSHITKDVKDRRVDKKLYNEQFVHEMSHDILEAKNKPYVEEMTKTEIPHEYTHMLSEGINKEHNQFIDTELAKINADDIIKDNNIKVR